MGPAPMCVRPHSRSGIAAPHSGRRFLPTQAREAGIVAITGDPGAAALDGEGGKPGLRGPRASRVRLDAQAGNYSPMSLAGPHDIAMGLAKQIAAKRKRFADRTGPLEYPGIGRDPHDGAQRERRYAELRVAGDDVVDPALAYGMPRRDAATPETVALQSISRRQKLHTTMPPITTGAVRRVRSNGLDDR